jgi:hypothetical protein
MIAFYIEGLRHTKYIARTVCNAEFAPLAAILNNDHLASARLDTLQIQGFSPVFHAAIPLLCFMPVTDLTKKRIYI